MASAVVVLGIMLIVRLLVSLIALAATCVLARWNGQSLKSMSWSLLRGYTAEFFPPGEERKADTTDNSNA
jgi:hypothetical protein